MQTESVTLESAEMEANPNTPLRLVQSSRVLRMTKKVSLNNDKIDCA